MAQLTGLAAYVAGMALLEDDEETVARLVQAAEDDPGCLHEAREVLPTLEVSPQRAARANGVIGRAISRLPHHG